MKITKARKGKLIGTSGFAGYDHYLNPYVGCEFGCKYCYVQFFLNSDLPWGEWVKTRDHIVDKLATDLQKIGSTRLVIGTMCDPYQPQEGTSKLTRISLETIARIPMKKVGIFTRSALVLRDIDIISQIPNCRVHFTISPFDEKLRQIIEPGQPTAAERFDVVAALKAAGIRTHVSVAPLIPIISENLIREYAERMADLQVDEFFVDPMQLYSEPYKKIESALKKRKEWPQIEAVMGDKAAYRKWKGELHKKWITEWGNVSSKSPHTMPISSDHVTKTKINLNTGERLDWKKYDDYEEED